MMYLTYNFKNEKTEDVAVIEGATLKKGTVEFLDMFYARGGEDAMQYEIKYDVEEVYCVGGYDHIFFKWLWEDDYYKASEREDYKLLADFERCHSNDLNNFLARLQELGVFFDYDPTVRQFSGYWEGEMGKVRLVIPTLYRN